MDEPLHETLTRHAIRLEGIAYGKRTWLENFSAGRHKRPDHDIEEQGKDLASLEYVAEMLRRSAERHRAQSGEGTK